MSGFDNGTMQSGIHDQVKRTGPVLRGSGPPVPQAGVLGDLYVSNSTGQLFEKRAVDYFNPWGHYLFVVPEAYRATLRWFSIARPSDDVGAPGDYCLLWGGYPNYGLGMVVYGPKDADAGWPDTPATVDVEINPLYTAEDQRAVG